MKNWLFLAGFLAIFIGASEANAACKISSGGVTACGDVRLTNLYFDAAGVFIETDSDELALSGSASTACNPESGIYLWLDRNNANYQAMVSSLLSAKLANSVLTIRVVRSMGEGMNLRCTVAWIKLT